MIHLAAVVLAAGEGKRMKTSKSKVIHKILGKSLVEWACESVKSAGISECILVVGHKSEQVMELMGNKVKYALQEKQLGTGHAVMQAEEYLKDKEGYVMVLYGDMPLVTSETIGRTLECHKAEGYSVTIITADMDDPTGYGRVIRGKQGDFIKVVEEKDASLEEKKLKEINSGLYCFTIKDLLAALKELKNENNQGEFYLTDVPEIIKNKGLKVGIIKINDSNEVLGINDRVQLNEAAVVLRKRILTRLMKSGVTLIDPNTTYIDDEVEIGMDSIIYPGTIIEGRSVIGEDCIIGPGTRIVNSQIGDKSEVINSIVLESSIGKDTHVGPFAYIRPESRIGNKVRIGDFVEIKKSEIGDFAKVSHLAYIGDAEIGKNVNYSCGAVTVNYDGKKKHKTIVGDNAFVGCNVNLIAPIKVNSDSYIAAGSTITDEVPGDALAIARARQVNKEGWVTKRKSRDEKK